MQATTGIVLIAAAIVGSACGKQEEMAGREVQSTAAVQPATPVPDGYSDFMVFLADGDFNPTDPATPPPSADWFYGEIMKYSAEQTEARRLQAVDHYRSRFGADIDDPVNQGRLLLQPFAIDPRTEYRAVMIAERNVPPTGWDVRDGGWLLVITDPDGFVLGGDFDGTRAAFGPAAAFGDYYILTDGDPIHIPYQAEKPWSFSSDGEVAFSCDLRSPELGNGRARGLQRLGPSPAGDLQLQIRNVVSFP